MTRPRAYLSRCRARPSARASHTAQCLPLTEDRAPSTGLVAKRSLVLLAFAVSAACRPDPVIWTEPSAHALLVSPAATHDTSTTFQTPLNACPNSLAIAQMSGTELFATWWQSDSSGRTQLAVARTSDSGASWSTPEPADNRDRAGSRCPYPPPAIAADSATGYVHLSYFLQTEDGAGVWYTHSMDRGRSWHAATALIFGDAPARSSIGADGWLLAVAYEAPYAPSRQIWLTLSRDAGHTFERPSSVTQRSVLAANPSVWLDGRSISVKWTERAENAATERIVARDGVVSIDANPTRGSH